MGVQERKLRQKEELRQEILDAARHLFVTDGYESVSMRKVAERIEYSPTTIYLYFKDKSDLLDCICEESFLILIEELQGAAGSSMCPMQSLRSGLRSYIDFGLRHPEHYMITFILGERGAALHGPRSKAMGCNAFHVLADSVAACGRAGLLIDNNVEKVSQVLWCIVHGVTSLLVSHPSFAWGDKEMLIESALDLAMRGVDNAFVEQGEA